MECESGGRVAVVDLPELRAPALEAHPPLAVYPETSGLALLTLNVFRLQYEISLLKRRRQWRSLGRPPAFLCQVQLFKANFEPCVAIDLLTPDVTDKKISHRIPGMRKLSIKGWL